MNSQWDTSVKPFEWWTSTFAESIKSIGKTVLVLAPWKDPVPLRRSWCLFEMLQTIDTSAQLVITMPPAERAHFVEALGANFGVMYDTLCEVSLQQARATSKADHERIFEVVNSRVGVHALDIKILQTMRDWLVSTANGVLITGPTRATDIASIAKWHESNGIAWKGGLHVCAALIPCFLAADDERQADAMLEQVLKFIDVTLAGDMRAASLLNVGEMRDLVTKLQEQKGSNHPRTLEMAYLLVDVLFVAATDAEWLAMDRSGDLRAPVVHTNINLNPNPAMNPYSNGIDLGKFDLRKPVVFFRSRLTDSMGDAGNLCDNVTTWRKVCNTELVFEAEQLAIDSLCRAERVLGITHGLTTVLHDRALFLVSMRLTRPLVLPAWLVMPATLGLFSTGIGMAVTFDTVNNLVIGILLTAVSLFGGVSLFAFVTGRPGGRAKRELKALRDAWEHSPSVHAIEQSTTAV